MLGTELRVSCVLGKSPTAELHPLPPSVFLLLLLVLAQQCGRGVERISRAESSPWFSYSTDAMSVQTETYLCKAVVFLLLRLKAQRGLVFSLRSRS